MTVLDLDLADGEAVRAELSCPADLAAIALFLPEQEWCAQCALDETSEPGMPRDVVSRSVAPVAVLPVGGNSAGEPGSLCDITWLFCGHTIAQLPASRMPGQSS